MTGCHAKYEETHMLEKCAPPPYCPSCPTTTFKLQMGHEYMQHQPLTFAGPGVLKPMLPGEEWCAMSQCPVDATDWTEDCRTTVWLEGKGPKQGISWLPEFTEDSKIAAMQSGKCCFSFEDAPCIYDQKLPACSTEAGEAK